MNRLMNRKTGPQWFIEENVKCNRSTPQHNNMKDMFCIEMILELRVSSGMLCVRGKLLTKAELLEYSAVSIRNRLHAAQTRLSDFRDGAKHQH